MAAWHLFQVELRAIIGGCDFRFHRLSYFMTTGLRASRMINLISEPQDNGYAGIVCTICERTKLSEGFLV